MAPTGEARLPRDTRPAVGIAEALEKPDKRDAAASAIRGPIERIVLKPGADGLHVTLKGDFGAILDWTGSGDKKCNQVIGVDGEQWCGGGRVVARSSMHGPGAPPGTGELGDFCYLAHCPATAG